MKRVYCCLPVHNEQEKLEKCILSFNIAAQNINNSIVTIICLNGCIDNSFNIAKKCQKMFPLLNIIIIKSKKGKLNAQKKMLSLIPKNYKVFFMDADTEIMENSLKILLNEMDHHKELIAVGGFPVAKKYNGKNIYKKFLDNILNIRSRHPMSEVSKLDVSDYHSLAILDPQYINTNVEHELKSKIFFHGRLFLLKSKKYWNYPLKNKGVVGDDSYIPDYIIYYYGKNRIRIRYDALIYFEPFTSLREHYNAYKRIYFDLKNLKENFPQFRDIREHSSLILNKEYIKEQPSLEKLKFLMYKLIRKIELFLYSFSDLKNPEEIWKKS